jgi:Carboxypeptidase regulatory-like domain/TonB dependent receptor
LSFLGGQMTKSKTAVLLLGILTVICFSVVTTSAQAVYGSVSGSVTDSAGAAIPDATITITSVDRQTVDTVTTNSNGFYTKDRLLPGLYNIKVEKQGFKAGVNEKVTVSLDTQTKIDATLEAGQVSEVVTILSEGELLKTDRADVATTFETRQIADLPILDRNFTKLILLTPGTVQQQWGHAASENPQGSTQTSVNGQTFAGTGFQLDGTDNRDPILGIIVINPNFESIGETKITSQNYDAEFGQAIAGVASVQTKSGTNQLHGSLFDYRRSDAQQARNPFSQSRVDSITGKAVPATLRNQFGFSLGGPIIKDRFFIFGDYQGTRSRIGGTQLLSVPTAAARAGNLSAYGRTIYDPNLSVVNSGGRVTSSTQFAGNIIPMTRLSPQALALLRLIPLPNLAGVDNGTRDNYAASGNETFNNDSFNIRSDARLGDKANLFARYSYARYDINGGQAFGAGGGAQFVTLGGASKVRNKSLATGFDYSLSPTTVLDMRFGYFRYFVDVKPNDFGKRAATDLGIPGLNFDDGFTSGLPGIFIQGAVGAVNFGTALDIARCNCPLIEDEKQYQVVTNLTKISGNHTIKFGVDVRRAFNLRIPSDAHRSGQLFIDGTRTGGLATPGNIDSFQDGFGLATFLLGDVTSFNRYVSTSITAAERQWRHYYYAQDTWRITPKLTLAYGIRADVINPQTLNAPGNGGFLSLDTGQIRTAGIGDTNLAGNVKNKVNFAPRLGVAYQISDKTVLRAGYGRSYDTGVFGSVFGHSVTQNLPVLGVQALSKTNIQRVFNLAAGPPAFTNFFGLNAAPNRGGVPNTSLPSSGTFFLPNGVFARALTDKQRLPQVDAYNVTLQHQLTSKMSVEVAYVGNKGTHAFIGNGPAANVNQPTVVGIGTLTQDQRKPFFGKFGWTQGIDYFCNCADTRYDGLQMKVTQRLSGGLTLLAHFTIQRALDNSGDYFFIDRSVNRGPNDFDRSKVFVFSETYELPFGRNKRFFGGASKLADLFIGGFQISSNTTIQSGVPFNLEIRTPNDTGPNRPNVNGKVTFGQARDKNGRVIFITSPFSDFTSPTLGQFGNLKRNALRGPGFWQTDASLIKRFNISETKNLEFRMEIQNLFNTVNLAQPSTNTDPDPNPANNTIDARNFGKINGTNGNAVQRNVQFAFRFAF